MYDSAIIEQLFGKSALDYVRHKNRGGASGSKGNAYENFFAVYQLALLAEEVLESGCQIYFLSQVLAFVDDLIIDRTEPTHLEHFQLKDSERVGWGTGHGSIADDFQKQYQLNQALSRTSTMTLIVSNLALKARLEKRLPVSMREYSQVQYFPSGASLVRIIAQEPAFRRAIEDLCAIDQPEPDKVECVATVLLGAWVSSNQSRVSVMDLLLKAQEATFSFIRPFKVVEETDVEFLEILDKIDDFTYNFSKGFFHWQYASGLLKGDFPRPIDTEHFRRFRDRIKRLKPTSFEELEDLLL